LFCRKRERKWIDEQLDLCAYRRGDDYRSVLALGEINGSVKISQEAEYTEKAA
jgi:hypothetical protein